MPIGPPFPDALRDLVRSAEHESAPCSATDDAGGRCGRNARWWCAQCQAREPHAIAARCSRHEQNGYCARCRAIVTSIGALRRRLFPEIGLPQE